MHLFERTAGGKQRAPVTMGGLRSHCCAASWTTKLFRKTVEELEMLAAMAGEVLDEAGKCFPLAGKTTVFFGSGMNNFRSAIAA